MSRLALAEAELLFPDAICQMDSALGWMIHERDLELRLRFYDPFTANGTPKPKKPDVLTASCSPHPRIKVLRVRLALKQWERKMRRNGRILLDNAFYKESARLLALGWHASALWDPAMGIWIRATFYVRTMERVRKKLPKSSVASH